MNRLLIAVVAFYSHAALACSVSEGPNVIESLQAGASIAIVTPVRIEGPKRPDRLEASRNSSIQVVFLDDHKVTATLRIVEPLVGGIPRIQEISYFPEWCGGHRFEAGRYYILAVDPSVKVLDLALGSNTLLGLGDEYMEEAGARQSESVLIKLLLEYPKTGSLDITPEALLKYRDLTRPRYESPSTPR